jgi:hypothetical protein
MKLVVFLNGHATPDDVNNTWWPSTISQNNGQHNCTLVWTSKALLSNIQLKPQNLSYFYSMHQAWRHQYQSVVNYLTRTVIQLKYSCNFVFIIWSLAWLSITETTTDKCNNCFCAKHIRCFKHSTYLPKSTPRQYKQEIDF